METAEKLITENLEVWSSAVKAKSSAGRGSSKKRELYGDQKLRELVLELAIRGLLVPQSDGDEHAETLLKSIGKKRAQLLAKGEIKKPKPVPSISDEDKSFDIPAGWAWTQLGEIAEIGPRNTIEDSLEVAFVPMPLITTSYQGEHGQEARLWSEVKKGYTHFSDGDIALAKITPCFENSKAAIFQNLTNGHGAGTTELHIARPYQDFVDSRFVLLYLKAPMFLERGKPKMTGSAGQKRIPASYFIGNPLPFPPLAEQHRIVAKVDELMALCDQLEQEQESSLDTHDTLVATLLGALATATADTSQFAQAWQRIQANFDTLFTTASSIDQLKQTILQLAVMGKLVPQDPNDEPASELLKTIATEKAKLVKEGKIKKQKALPPISKNEKSFKLPNTWEWVRLRDITSKITDGDHKTPPRIEAGKRLLSAKNVRDGFLDYDNTDYIAEADYIKSRERCMPEYGDLLMVSVGGTIGRSSLVPSDSEFALVRSVALIKPLLFEPAYLKYTADSPLLQDSIHSNKRGGAQPCLYLSEISKFPFPLPPLAEQHRIVAKVDELMSLCDQLKANLITAQATQLNLADCLVEQAIG